MVDGVHGRSLWLRWLWRAGVTGIVVYAANRAVSIERLAWLVCQVRASVMVEIGVLGIAAIGVHAVRWRMALACRGVRISKIDALRTYVWGTALAFVTPGRLGEFVRGVGLSHSSRMSSVEAVAVDKFYVAGAVMAGGCVGAVAHVWVAPTMPGLLWALSCAWLIGIGGWLVVAVWRGKGLTHKYRFLAAADGWWNAIRGSVKEHGLSMFLYACAAHGLLVLQTALLLEMFGGGGMARNVVVSSEAFALMLLLPFSIGNMGVREFSLLAYWGALVSPGPLSATAASEVCLGASAVILIANIVVPSLVGAAWELVHQLRKPASAQRSASRVEASP